MEVETDKAVAPVECPFGGKILKVHVKEGDTVPIGATLLTIEDSGDGKAEAKASGARGPSEGSGAGGQGSGGGKEARSEKPEAKERKPAQEAAAKPPSPREGGAKATPSASQRTATQTHAESIHDVKVDGKDVVDLVVLGGGPGGYPAAFDAADHGLKVVLVDENAQPGGVCLRVGCIPSKALLHVAKLIHEAKEASHWGLTFNEPKLDLDKLRQFKNGVVTKLTGGVGQLAKGRGVKIVQARGTFVDSHTLNLQKPDGSTEQLKFKKCIVAVGSRPTMPPIFDIGDKRVMTSTGALDLPDVPKKFLVIGGGYIGLEMGTVYAALGSRVTVVEMTGGLLPGADRDLVKPLQTRLEKEFEAIHLDTKVEKLEAKKEGIAVTVSGKAVEKGAPATQVFDRVLIAIGRLPNGKGIGLENTKAEVDQRGHVKVDRRMQTADPDILAIGDVAGEPMLAHKATREAKVAVATLLGEPSEFDNVGIPAVVFTDPEIAWVGLSETEAEKQGRKVKVAKFPWAASGRAQTIDRLDGLTKLICDPETERILGVGIVGAGAGELIAEGTLAVEMAAVARDVADTIHAHPTLSETMMESGEAIFGQATHYFRPKR
ncbi:MAG: dihydrolipoyl dehydrogenase [Planctomycetaceae bacterium]|nr:dihydrolipoyl dehydrogenase [Planctomycetaceae bacterium]